MTEYSITWNNNGIGDASRSPYDAQEWADVWRYMVGNGASRANAGIVRGNGADEITESLLVSPSSPAARTVVLGIGSALVDGTQYVNTAALTLTVAPNGSGNPRIDTIILRKTYAAQTIRAVVLQGTAAATPAPAALTQNGTQWEIPIAYLELASAYTTITITEIQAAGFFANANDSNYVWGFNGSIVATPLDAGTVVVWYTDASSRTILESGDPNSSEVAGVLAGYTAIGAYGRVQTSGVAYVNITGTVVKGDTLVAAAGGTVSRQINGYPCVVGRAIEDGANGRVLAQLSVVTPRVRLYNTNGSSIWNGYSSTVANSINSVTLTDINYSAGVPLRVAGYYYGGKLKITFTARVPKTLAPRFAFIVNATLIYSPAAITAQAVTDYVTITYISAAAVVAPGFVNVGVQFANNAGGTTTIASGDCSLWVEEIAEV